MKHEARPNKEKNRRTKGREEERPNGEAENTAPPSSSSLHTQVCSLPFSRPCSKNNVC